MDLAPDRGDFEDRLVECGLTVERVDPVSLLGGESDLTVALDTLLGELAQARRTTAQARAGHDLSDAAPAVRGLGVRRWTPGYEPLSP